MAFQSTRVTSSGSATGSGSDAVYDAVRKLQDRCARRGVLWGDDFSPLSDIHLSLLLERFGVEWEFVAMEGIVEAVWPATFGLHLLQLAREQTPGARRFALRHGLAHVIGYHTEIAAADDGSWQSFEETVADLFAAVDVLPDVKLEELREAGYSEEEVERWCYSELSRWTSGWPGARTRDRVRLRLDFG